MMGDGRDARLGDEMRQCQPQRNVHRNAQRILNDEDIDAELLNEVIERLFQVVAQFVNTPGQLR